MNCAVLDGFGAKKVRVEVDIARGLPNFTLVGLALSSVKESRVRVQAAISNAGFDFPRAKISVNLAPADVEKNGTAFDLSIALSILQASGVIAASKMEGIAAIGELSLTGEIKPVRGMLALAESVCEQGLKYLLVAKENAQEASLISGIEVRAVDNFGELVEAILNERVEQLKTAESQSCADLEQDWSIDMSDVVGQEEARQALLIAAAGNHNLVYIGGAGSGKSMMASRLPTILPPLSYEEALVLTKIYSIAGLTVTGNLISKRPFRSPHHSITKAGLVGGGSSYIRPGEISLANFGVLFLDELLEFPRAVLEILRQPLENGEVTLSRARHTITYPAEISLVAALNPCPCGYYGQGNKCNCSSIAVNRYQSRLSGPLIDRIDLHVSVPPLDLKLMENSSHGEPSASMRAKVIKARKIQKTRFNGLKTNGKMTRNDIKKFALMTTSASHFLVDAASRLGVSARSYDRIIRVARTIADLEEENNIHKHHIAQALSYRPVAGLIKS